ncbi:MAG: hypothetical protein U0Y82_07285 [Thermoleophilia bacterium]
MPASHLPRRIAAMTGCALCAVIPAASAAGPALPADQQAALDRLNTRYRQPMGLPDLQLDPALVTAASSHVAYWAANGVGDGMSMHAETPGAPGFTGATPEARCQAAGAAAGCAEDAFPGVADADNAMAGWLGVPMHGSTILSARSGGLGSGTGGTVATLSGLVGPSATADPSAAPNTPGATLHVWPADGTVDVPLRWGGAELPDPLDQYTGDHDDVGPALYVLTAGPARVSLFGPEGLVPLLTMHAAEADTRVDIPGGDAVTAVLVARALHPGGAYALTVSDATHTFTGRFRAVGTDPVMTPLDTPGTPPPALSPASGGTTPVPPGTSPGPRVTWRLIGRRLHMRAVVPTVGADGLCTLERRIPGGWGMVARAGVDAAGVCRVEVPLRAGRHRLRVLFEGAAAFAGRSAVLHLRVRP